MSFVAEDSADLHEDTAETSIGQTKILSDSKHPLQCATEATNLQLRSLVTVSTTSTITADTVASLGGEKNAQTFVESVTANFANSFSAELEQKLQEACGDPIPLTSASTTSHGFIQDAADLSKLQNTPCCKIEQRLQGRKRKFQSDQEGETVNVTTSSKKSIKESMRHLEDYVEADLPNHLTDSPHNNPNAGSGDNLGHEQRTRTPDQDARENAKDESSMSSDSGRSNVGSGETAESSLGTKDLKVMLHKVDEISGDTGNGRVLVPYDTVARPWAQNHTLARTQHSKWVLTLRRIFRSDNKTLANTRLDIESDIILDVLRQLPLSQLAMLESTASLDWPDDDVFRYRDKIKRLALSLGELAVRHVDVLLQLIEEEYLDRINDIKELHPKGTSSFQILRELYWKGDTVINKQGTRAYRLVDAFIEERSLKFGEVARNLVLDSVYVDFQGERFGTIKDREKIPEFKGISYIKDLPRFPLSYHPDAANVARRLLERGQKFASLSGQRYMIHRSLVPNPHKGRYGEESSSEERSDSDVDSRVPSNRESARETSDRVVVDAAAFNRQTSLPIITKSLNKELVNGALTEQHLCICIHEVPVFSMRDKSFYKAPVDEIHEIVFNERVFGQLVIPEATKDLIRALVESHARESDVDDFVEGKGKGLVILLHGPPGVGKTMTAEAVAEHTRRPLYAVTSGELGETTVQLESNLRTVLDRAKNFRAVILLDEADVFVEERKPQDLGRNALVSIFLRELEYYQGILVLTTNRVQTFDHAFQSRIHVSIGYSELDTDARERIWRLFGDHVVGGLHIADADYAELATWKLNGRQIKNIVSCSKALASSRGDDLTMVYLRIVKDIVGSSQSWA